MKDVRVSVEDNEYAARMTEDGRLRLRGRTAFSIGTELVVDDRTYRVVSHEIEETGPVEETVLTVERVEAG